jgi:hypothetical protein
MGDAVNLSSVASYAIGQWLNMILLNQLATNLGLIWGIHIVDVEDLGSRADIPLRLPVTVDAPVHVESVDPVHQRHFIHLAMAGRATDALVDVNAVIEINEVGKVVDACPLNWFSACPAISNGLRQRSARPDLRVARHAGFRRWETRERRVFDAGMTVPAVNAVVFHMMFVTEKDGLFRRYANWGNPMTTIDDVRYAQRASRSKNHCSNGNFRDRVRARPKQLCHKPASNLRTTLNADVIIIMSAYGTQLLLMEILKLGVVRNDYRRDGSRVTADVAFWQRFADLCLGGGFSRADKSVHECAIRCKALMRRKGGFYLK